MSFEASVHAKVIGQPFGLPLVGLLKLSSQASIVRASDEPLISH